MEKRLLDFCSGVPIFALMLLVAAGPAPGETVTTGQGDGADAFIEAGSDGVDTFGGDGELRVRSHPEFPVPNDSDQGRYTRKTYLRFDLSSLTVIPRAGEASDVVLTLTWKNAFSGGDGATYGGLPWTVNLYGLKDTSLGVTGDNDPSSGGWTENTIAGDNAPANDPDKDGSDGGAPTKGLTDDATDVLVSVTLESAASSGDALVFSSAALTDFLRADTNAFATLILVAGNDSQGGGSIASFWSAEGFGAAPSLAVTDGTPPPPPPPEPGPEEALAQVDALFEDYFAWFGSMYHRQSGGSYYSLAARTVPEDYPPHIETTSKFNRVIEWSERIPNVPTAMRNDIVAWTKNNQVDAPGSSNYGYFLADGYSFNDKEKSRALGFSTGILENYGATPDHPLPGEAGTLPSHLNSVDAFIAWLDNRNWSRTWTAGGDLLTQGGYIRQLDETLRQDILNATWEYLETEQQDPATGLWGELNTGGNRNPYIALNGAHKIAAFFKDFDQPVPYAENLMDTARSQVASTVPTNLLYTYNSSQLVHNLTFLGATISEEETADFVEKQAEYLASFFRPDGGVATTVSGVHSNTYFEPGGVSETGSNTDRGGLCLKARDRLHDLVYGFHNPLPFADDPRIFGMSGLNSEVLARYEFTAKSPAADTLSGSGISAGTLTATGTDGTTGSGGDGYHQDTDPGGGSGGDFEIGHAGFDDTSSYYTFTLTPGAETLRLYFLALTMRHGGSGNEEVVLTYRVGDAGNFVEAGRTTIRGGAGNFLTRDIPLMTLGNLQDLDDPVTFRIHGWNFGGAGQTFHINSVELHGVERAQSYDEWIGAQGLSGDDALPETALGGARVSNVERYAYNLGAPAATYPVLEPGAGTSGLPHKSVTKNAGPPTFRFEFLRRVQSNLVYRPMVCPDLMDPTSWRHIPEPPDQVTPIDDEWERVVYTFAAPSDHTGPLFFGRVDVTLP